ncbi:MAG TPA: pyridoxal phosphate-dependent aminotransferase [Vicinamibacterales bacterium]|nr:pyridoxal phosphate-dependent aminotransferase [Vicinamibacterales bacterium]
MFSSRVPDDRTPNRLARALARARERGGLADLTVSNPTRAGISYPADLLAGLADPAALDYAPSPFGLPAARDAIRAEYARRGIDITSDRIVLTASTSEAYSLLFKLLCEPGRSTALTPAPSYPLFDHLTRLDGVGQRRYLLEYHGVWTIDRDDLDAAWSDDTRVVLTVTPNNPTGALLDPADADELVSRCARRRAALIVDEVFCDYPLAADAVADPPALSAGECLVFRLGGLSKTIGLPQVKLGWIAVQGPEADVAEALDRLELICDTYLSVSTPIQMAAPRLLTIGSVVRDSIRARVRGNYARLRSSISTSGGAAVLPADGGWSAVVRVPAIRSEEALVLDLLERDRVVVHPGYFFDFPHEAFLVVSLLADPDVFARGLRAIEARIHGA